MGLFFNRKKNKKSKKEAGESIAQPNFDVLEPLDLTNAIDSEPSEKKLSRREKRAAKKQNQSSSNVTETISTNELDIAQNEASHAQPPQQMERPIVPPVEVPSTGDATRDAMAKKFAELRQVVAQKKSDEAFEAEIAQDPVSSSGGLFGKMKSAKPDDGEDGDAIEIGEDNIVQLGSASAPELDVAEDPQDIEESYEPRPSVSPDAIQVRLDDAWLGLWIAEDGRAIIVEEGDPGDYFITAMPDPMSKCYTGPDYPEIETWRMPAHFLREQIGEIEGDRLVVNSVPGLPAEHQAPTVFLYFLVPDREQEGENRFAQRGEGVGSVFLVTDSEPGTVNPWGDGDNIIWLGEPGSFYKAPEKLDIYIDKRLRKSDPSNLVD